MKFIHFLVKYNLIVALSVCSLCFFTQSLFNCYDINLLYFVFFSSLFSYEITKQKYLFTKFRLFFLGITGLFSIFYAKNFSINILLFLLPFFLISIFYIFPIKIFGKSFALRNISYLKIFLITTVWTAITVGLPLLSINKKIPLWYFFQIWLFILAITIPFDIRDLNKDNSKMKTIPQILGIKNSIFLATKLCNISLLLILIQKEVLISEKIFASITYCITILFIKNSKNKNYLYYALGLESCPIILGLLQLLQNTFIN